MTTEERSDEVIALREQVARLARQAAADHKGFVESRKSLVAQRDAALALVAELGKPVISRAARNPGCVAFLNSDGSIPAGLVDAEIVERKVYYTPWVVVRAAAEGWGQ